MGGGLRGWPAASHWHVENPTAGSDTVIGVVILHAFPDT